MRDIYVWLFLMVVSIVNSAFALASQEVGWQQLNWQIHQNTGGIQIETAPYPGSKFLAIKSSMTVNARLQDVANLALLNDGCHEGLPTCEVVKVLHSINPQNYTQYVISNFPWPLKQRDIVLKVQVEQDEQAVIRITGESQAADYILQKDIVRIKDMQVLWQLSPLANNQVLVEHFIHSDPEGFILSWVFNQAVDEVPVETFQNMQRLLTKKEYQNQDIAFLKEPND